jgi:hypothetical protein
MKTRLAVLGSVLVLFAFVSSANSDVRLSYKARCSKGRRRVRLPKGPRTFATFS